MIFISFLERPLQIFEPDMLYSNRSKVVALVDSGSLIIFMANINIFKVLLIKLD